MSKPYIRQWQVPSSMAGKTYIVSLSSQGDWSCACVGWTSHVPRRACKHIKIAKETGDTYLLWSDAANFVTVSADLVHAKKAPAKKKQQLVMPFSKNSRAITFDD